MSKSARQTIGILAAVIAYYLVHEGAHLLYALFTGVFRQIKFMGLGVLLLVDGLVFWKRVLPVYSRSFSDTEVQV